MSVLDANWGRVVERNWAASLPLRDRTPSYSSQSRSSHSPSPPSSSPSPLSLSLSKRIPLDVIDSVMENVFSEANRLSIALVCKDWYTLSTQHHYPDITICSRKSCNRLLDLHAHHNGQVRRRLSDATILRIHWPKVDAEPFCDAIPLLFGPRMPGVNTLIFENCIHPPMHPTFTRGLRSSFQGIRVLAIVNFSLVNFGELRDIVLACPQADTLILRHGGCKRLGVRLLAPRSRTRGPQLRRLELCHLEASLFKALVNWFRRHTECCDHITDLSITDVTGSSVLESRRLLRVIGDSLKRLSLVDMQEPLNISGGSTITLAVNPSLLCLNIELEEGKSCPQACDFQLAKWRRILLTVPETTRSDIEVSVIEKQNLHYSDFWPTYPVYVKHLHKPYLWDLWRYKVDGHTCHLSNNCGYRTRDPVDYFQHLTGSHPTLLHMQPEASLLVKNQRDPQGIRTPFPQYTSILTCQQHELQWSLPLIQPDTPDIYSSHVTHHLCQYHKLHCTWTDMFGDKCHVDIAPPTPTALIEHISRDHWHTEHGIRLVPTPLYTHSDPALVVLVRTLLADVGDLGLDHPSTKIPWEIFSDLLRRRWCIPEVGIPTTMYLGLDYDEVTLSRYMSRVML
ncbi:hypothetical protein DAEQUDRAFT_527587 [Daedalea quercina L-15889]|uniref:F-box domain-containing protein n=1 Tax=Daedalea quercina L-15889 TaxID=1314783 RepID=A0A165M9S6_9APHY|nr:hypothetical protein DAEQUDRAFT_527587 [Daedalea quercina L-15889]